jgi:hypothetical protein
LDKTLRTALWRSTGHVLATKGKVRSGVIKQILDKTLRTALWHSKGHVLATKGKVRSGIIKRILDKTLRTAPPCAKFLSKSVFTTYQAGSYELL